MPPSNISEHKEISELFRSASGGIVDLEELNEFWVSREGSSDLQTGFEAAARHNCIFLISSEIDVNYQFGKLSFTFRRESLTNPDNALILGERIALDTASLRRAFTFLEYAVFFLSKYPKNENDPNYDEKSETFSERIKLLKHQDKISADLADNLRAIKNTRDQFAHSFVEIEDLTFNGDHLKYVGEEFFSTLQASAKVIETKFVALQGKQVDWRLFSIVFNALRKAPSF